MNYSAMEHYGVRTEQDVLVEEVVALLPQLGPALFGAISRVAHEHGLTLAQTKAVLQVATHGRMPVGEIACRLNVSMPAASEVVDRLVEAGHLVRASDPADRRRVLIEATPATLRIAAELNDIRRGQVRRALEAMPPEERPVLARSLHALLSGLSSEEAFPATDCHTASDAGSRSRA